MSTQFSLHTIERLRRIQHLLDQLDSQAKPQALIVPGSPQPRGNIIVFPGSFNPPTNAHLAMLKQAWHFGSQHGGISIYAAMSKRTTDKENVERPLLVDRVLLLETVIQHHLRETGIMLFNRGLYVEQAEGVHTAYPGVRKLYFLLGFDKIVQIFDPHYYHDRDAALRELFALAQILVAPRAGAGPEQLKQLLDQPKNAQFAQYVHLLPLDASYRDISSTLIRQGFEAHQEEVPPEAQRFIRETHAYDPPEQAPDGSQVDLYEERAKAIQALLSANA